MIARPREYCHRDRLRESLINMVFVVSQLPLSSEISQFCSSGACPSPLLPTRAGGIPRLQDLTLRIPNFGQLGEIQNHTWSALTDSSCLLIKSITIVYRFMITRCRPVHWRGPSCTGCAAALQPADPRKILRGSAISNLESLNISKI